MQNLVVVESPTKARTLAKFLGGRYQIEASMGHIRDLPKSEIGVDVERNFELKYIIPKDKIKRVNELKKVSAEAQTLWLATDPDREGEAIAWHLSQIFESGKKLPKIHRVIFHEITPSAVKEAFASPGEINLQLVDAQQARRVLDRLVGYKLSPLLWKKVKSGLSAGRVQSVALRLVVERERQVQAFKPQEYWTVEVVLETQNQSKAQFKANLFEQNGKKIAINNKSESDNLVASLKQASYKVERISQKEVRRYPYPPFTTSTLQQTAANHLGFSAKKTMMLAQFLYERGIITYMRTDSLNLSLVSISDARKYILQKFGKKYLPSSPRLYKTKSKVAQEAHEAIRPTDIKLTSDKLKTIEGLSRDHLRLYELIWKRLLASQTAEAVMDQTTVDVKALKLADIFILRTIGSVLKFDGWLKIFGLEADLEEDKLQPAQILPQLKQGEPLAWINILPTQHFTEAPARYNEASLIKKLEELGVGRPSTYAPTLSTIQDRYYVEKVDKKFFPTELGVAVTDFLTTNFPGIVDYAFTAGMEDQLDEIARGERKWRETISEFYKPFAKKVEQTAESAARVEIKAQEVDKKCPDCGKPLAIKFGRFGKFLACSGFPECKHTEGLEEKVNAKCPDCGGDILLRKTKRGKPFYGCQNWPKCKFASWTKPKSSQAKVSAKV